MLAGSRLFSGKCRRARGIEHLGLLGFGGLIPGVEIPGYDRDGAALDGWRLGLWRTERWLIPPMPERARVPFHAIPCTIQTPISRSKEV